MNTNGIIANVKHGVVNLKISMGTVKIPIVISRKNGRDIEFGYVKENSEFETIQVLRISE